MIFLINGKARSGKDTVADYIVKKLNAKKLWFAKPLKDMAIKYFHLTEDECYDHKTEFSRRVLQALGELFREEVSKLYWVEKVVAQIYCEATDKSPQQHFVISDCRYQNEIIELLGAFDLAGLRELVKKLPKEQWNSYKREMGIVNDTYSDEGDLPIPCVSILVERGGCPEIEYGANHSSENDLNSFPFDVVIRNDGTLEELFKKVDDFVDAVEMEVVNAAD